MAQVPEGERIPGGKPDGDEKGKRKRCQGCHRAEAEHHCQVCRRFVCDDCVAPAGEVEASHLEDDLESFLQAALTRCRVCVDEAVRLPAHDVEHEPDPPKS